jgi:hypothetical protein
MSADDAGTTTVFIQLPTTSAHDDLESIVQLMRGVFQSLSVLIIGSIVLGIVLGLVIVAWRVMRGPILDEEQRRLSLMRYHAGAGMRKLAGTGVPRRVVDPSDAPPRTGGKSAGPRSPRTPGTPR